MQCSPILGVPLNAVGCASKYLGLTSGPAYYHDHPWGTRLTGRSLLQYAVSRSRLLAL